MRDLINFDQIIGESKESLLEYLDRDFVGFNEVEPLLRDYFVEDIECNGVNSPVYIIHRIYGNIKTNLIFKNIETLESFVEKLAQRCGKYISYSRPILDGSLPDGSRVNATYTKDITSRGPTFTIRKFTKTPWTPTQLLAFNTLSPEMLAYLGRLVQNRMNL
ncbi:MAG: type II/IV secretion system ATPase subunit [Nanoarchaeota archaeon]